MSFSALLDELEIERDNRAARREFAMLYDSVKVRGRRFSKSMNVLTAQLGTMAKSTAGTVAQLQMNQRADASARLAGIVARANEAAAKGELTAEQGAKLDIAIAHAAQHLAGL